MQIFINDIPVECQSGISLTHLLALQDIQPLNIAIAIDNTVIPKTQWETTFIREGSHILIIKAVQGG